MAITAERSDLSDDTTDPERCKNRKASITVSVTAVSAARKDAKKEAAERAKALKDERIAEMKRTIHCPTDADVCPSEFFCFEDHPWQYTRVRPTWEITPDDETKPTEWTAIRSYELKASLRCECIRGTIGRRDARKGAEDADELADLLGDRVP